MRALQTLTLLAVIAAASLIGTVPAAAQAPASSPTPAASASSLPTIDAAAAGAVTEVFVPSGRRALLKMAVAPALGDPDVGGSITDTESRDFTLSSLFQVLDPQSFTANPAVEGMGITPSSWRNVGAEGVTKAIATQRGSVLHVEMRLYVLARGATAVLTKSFDLERGGVRAAVHQFDNEVVKWFTGTPGSFGSRLLYSAKTGPGQRGIFSISSDGLDAARLPAVSNAALAPASGPGGVFYAGGLPDGSYSLFKVGDPVPVYQRPGGLVFGAAFHGAKMAVVVSRDGEADIWVGNLDGSGMQRVTSGGINFHPAFGPGGQLAYASNVGGEPQIYVDGKRVSWRGTYNVAPTWCNDPEGTKILFMGRDGSTWDIFSVDPSGSAGSMKRLTQDQGSNTYPACSPDGRTVAFFSTRGGLYLSNTAGMNQQKISGVMGESLRWEQ